MCRFIIYYLNFDLAYQIEQAIVKDFLKKKFNP